MIFPFVLLAVSLLVYIDQHAKSATQLHLPKDIQTWCPYTNFCNTKASKDHPEQNNKAEIRMKPCCKPCSCSKDCGLNRNCCTPQFDLHRIDEKLGTICKSLNTKELIGRNDDYFYIIDKCPGKLDTCRNMNYSIYGSFFPVFSSMNGMIYYSSYCASCHNQTEIVEFIPSLSCPSVTDNGMDELFNAINGFNLNCFFDFLTPENIDISDQNCYPTLIKDCEFMTNADFVFNCKSFNATFISKSYWYQNVYCYLCGRKARFPENKWSDKYTMCPASKNGRFIGDSALTVLIDKQTAQSYEMSAKNKKNKKDVCYNHKSSRTAKKKCLPILCPEGQFRVNGICQFLGEHWYVRDLALFLNLTPITANLTLSDLKEMPEDQLASPLRPYFTRPALKTWEMDIYYNLNGNVDKNGSSTVRFLLATLFLRNRMVKPRSLLSEVNRSLKGIWTLKIGEKTFTFTARLNKYVMYYLAGDKTIYVPFAFEQEPSNTSMIWVWTKHNSNKFGSNKLIITKLYFCNQVVLLKGEFNHTDFSPEIVVIISNSKSLGNAEFRLAAESEDAIKTKIRICLEDLFPVSSASRLSFSFVTIFPTLSFLINRFFN